MAEKKLTLEESVEKLQEIVTGMENPDVSLEDAFEGYRKGILLVKQCNDMIDAVEKEVKKISDTGELTDFE